MGSLMINHYTITAESESEKKMKIGQHLPKIWAMKKRSERRKHGAPPQSPIEARTD